MAKKTIAWDTADPSKGNITLNANSFSGTQDVQITSSENSGKTRSKRIAFYSVKNNLRSAALVVTQQPATCSLEWNSTGASTIVVGHTAASYNLFIKSNISSKDYIAVEATNLPSGWSIGSVENVSDGVFKVVMQTTKAGANKLTGSISVTVGEIDPVVASFTQNARYVVSSAYGNYTVANNSIKIAPKTGFNASNQLSAAGGTWGIFRGTSDVPYRVRTDTYNTGEVEYVNVDITDDTVLTVSAYNEAQNGRAITVLKNLTWGELKVAIAGTAGTDAVLQAGTLGTTYIDSIGYITTNLSCTNSEGGGYILYTTGSKYDASDGNETFRVPQEPNVFADYDFSDTTETWFNQLYRYSSSQALMMALPLLGGNSIPMSLKLRVMTTFTSGSKKYVNPYSIQLTKTAGNSGDVGITSVGVYPTLEEQLSDTPFNYQFKFKIRAYGGYIDSEYTSGIYYDDLFKPKIRMTSSNVYNYDGSQRGALYLGATSYGAVVHSSGWQNGQIDTGQRHLMINVGFRESNKLSAYKANANDPHIQLLDQYVAKYVGKMVYSMDSNLVQADISEGSYYSDLSSEHNIPALWSGQKIGEIAQNTGANGAFNWIQMHLCKGALFIPVGRGWDGASYSTKVVFNLYHSSGWQQDIASWSIDVYPLTGVAAGYSLFPGNSATGEWLAALNAISSANNYPLFLEIELVRMTII